MSAQRARSAVPADHRSAHPNIPGIPWWGAVLLAITMTAVGFAYDAGSGNKELDIVFASFYVLGCVFAVLGVRQSGVFTAVIQPPLILFGAVPTAYFLFHSGQVGGLKDLAINCGYPLIERFPLMFFTSAAVLLIGLGRWYYAMSSRRGASQSAARDTTTAKPSRVSSVTSKMSSLLTGDVDEDDDAQEPRRKHTIERPTRTSKSAKSGTSATRTARTTKRTAPSRSRHTRPPETELIEPVAERPRRPRPTRQTDQPPADPPRRRPRSSSTREPRKAAPPERRAPYERPERRRRYDDFPPREPHASNGNGNGTHHPVSRVRYRGADESDTRAENRSRPRASRNGWEAESWEYDI
ncbi:DUF6542 domain-containing protein [Mycobacterium sp. NPDC048908]|uniref:DUF6542 domain-containing protein n=1 Tax=Mycobacterium sp. NPDC048908 TaxID=3364292 RepID=UPI0037105EA5